MKLDYYTLLSPTPVFLTHVGHIKSPTLLEISNITYRVYNTYINILLMTIDKYYEMINENSSYFDKYNEEEKDIILNIKNKYDSSTEEEKSELSFFNIFIYDKNFCHIMQQLLNFFFVEDVVYDPTRSVFLIQNGAVDNNGNTLITGIINNDKYDTVVDVILQLTKTERSITEDKTAKVKNKIAERLLQKMKNANQKKKKIEDKKYELPNLISALATHSSSLNIINIWNLTIYQFYDQLSRQRLDDTYSSSIRSVSVWGDKDNKFDDTLWFTQM